MSLRKKERKKVLLFARCPFTSALSHDTPELPGDQESLENAVRHISAVKEEKNGEYHDESKKPIELDRHG